MNARGMILSVHQHTSLTASKCVSSILRWVCTLVILSVYWLVSLTT